MKGIVFEGDPLESGGYAMKTTSTLFESGKRAALIGDQVYCPKDNHGVNPIVEGDSTMIWDGKLLVTHLCKAACGCRVLARHSTLSVS